MKIYQEVLKDTGVSDENHITVMLKLKAVKVTDKHNVCKGCFFDKSGNCPDNGMCLREKRKDGRDIIFVEDK